MSIPFIDLGAQQRRLKPEIDAAIARVLAHGGYVMGPEVGELEGRLAAFCGAKRGLSCANGTDAIALPLMAWNVGAGDAVFCPSFTFAATAEVIPWTGAEPVFVDILPDTYNIDPEALEAAIEETLRDGRLKPKAIIAVDLFGQPADYPRIAAVARRYGLRLIADSAQGFGCTLNGQHPIAWADVVTTSFFPAKPLGAYGDGGAVLTNDDRLWELMDSLRIHGKATAQDLAAHTFEHDPKYLNVRIGMNSRLDTLQAAILLVKLEAFPAEIAAREAAAQRYGELLSGHVETPSVISGGRSVWAQYTVEHEDPEGLGRHLRGLGVPTARYYPIPMHLQAPYAGYAAPGGLPNSVAASRRVISLPMHADLTPELQGRIADAVATFQAIGGERKRAGGAAR